MDEARLDVLMSGTKYRKPADRVARGRRSKMAMQLAMRWIVSHYLVEESIGRDEDIWRSSKYRHEQ